MTNQYKPYSLKDIERGLRNPKYFYESARAGNLDAIIHLADSQLALKKAEPTETQLKALELVWHKEYTLQEAGEVLGLTKQGVRFHLQMLSIKLKKVVDEWAEDELNGEGT